MTNPYLECPNCSSEMREQFSKKNNVTLGKCTKCGGIHLGTKGRFASTNCNHDNLSRLVI